MSKLLVIGLDCCTPQFVFGEWKQELPNLARLMDEGVFGELESTVPPITVPAWTSMLSSKDPGQLGFYGFRNRKSHHYEELYFANGSYVREKRVWDYLNERGLRSILLGIPQTYPPRPLNGIMVGCFLTPDKSTEYTFPSSIKADLDRIAGGDYMIDVKDFRTNEKQRLLDQIYLMTRKRFSVVKHYLGSESWDFFMFVEMGVDRIHHAFWRYQDTGHRLYEKGGPYQDSIRKYYRYLDQEIGGLLDLLDPGVSVMVVSDHGAKKMDGAICINDWLIRKGLLCLKKAPERPCKLAMDMIDWEKTRAWGEGGYYSRVFLNVEGREPRGIIPTAGYESFREELRRELEALGDENGAGIGTRVFKPEEVYRQVNNIAPDLIVYFGDLNWRAAGTVGNHSVHIYENDTGPDDCNHAEQGIFILKTDPARLAAAGHKPGLKLEGLSIYDVAPTILDCFDMPAPADMIGKSVLRGDAGGVFTPAALAGGPDGEESYSEDDEEVIKKRLEDLGYL